MYKFTIVPRTEERTLAVYPRLALALITQEQRRSCSVKQHTIRPFFGHEAYHWNLAQLQAAVDLESGALIKNDQQLPFLPRHISISRYR